MKLFPLFASFFISMGLFAQRGDDVVVKKALQLMGTDFEISVVAPTEEIGYINIDEAVSEIKRIEAMISSWDKNSETSEVNRNAGIGPVRVSIELIELLERCIKISEISDGAFDVSYASMDMIWKYDGTMNHIPSETEIANSIKKIGYRKIILNKEAQTVFLEEEGMKIGFGAIGKGYAADKAKELLVSKGVRGGLVNAAGDLTTWGTRDTGEKWMIGITNPLKKDQVFSWLPVVESSVATSGNYEKYIVYKGKKYSHIIDPRTGYPTRGITSVSLFAKKAELCDALATAVFIMGTESGIHLINQLDGVEVVIIDSQHKIYNSLGISFDTTKANK